MASELASLIHDAASLHQFIGSTCRRQDEPGRSHRQATLKFLKYIRDLAENSQSFLQDFVKRAMEGSDDPDLQRFERQRLATIRTFWSSLHVLVRPVEDAHTLSIPVAFIEFLKRAISRIPGLEGCDIVIAHTSALNYFFYLRATFRYNAQRYEDIVGESPKFPSKLALIQIPYSQASNLFSNLVICHELGHLAFEEQGLESSLSSEIERALESLPNYDSMSVPDLSWCRERLKRWSEEIYCDRFAIGIIGPAYSFAYAELLDVAGRCEVGLVTNFSDTHPADACRFREHANQLRDGNWWSLLDESGGASYVNLIRKLEAVSEGEYAYESKDKPLLAESVLAAFIQLKSRIPVLVSNTLQNAMRSFRGNIDREEIKLVGSYLAHGVVPSTLIEKGTSRYPDPVVLINGAYLFYLENLPKLMNRIGGQDESNLSHRGKWAERIEMWTLKALEDLALLSNSVER